jgi:hypothetical protein
LAMIAIPQGGFGLVHVIVALIQQASA